MQHTAKQSLNLSDVTGVRLIDAQLSNQLQYRIGIDRLNSNRVPRHTVDDDLSVFGRTCANAELIAGLAYARYG